MTNAHRALITHIVNLVIHARHRHHLRLIPRGRRECQYRRLHCRRRSITGCHCNHHISGRLRIEHHRVTVRTAQLRNHRAARTLHNRHARLIVVRDRHRYRGNAQIRRVTTVRITRRYRMGNRHNALTTLIANIIVDTRHRHCLRLIPGHRREGQHHRLYRRRRHITRSH